MRAWWNPFRTRLKLRVQFLGLIIPLLAVVSCEACNVLSFYDRLVAPSLVCFPNDAPFLASSMREWTFARKQILQATFPIDQIKDNYIRQAPGVLFSEVKPSPFRTKTVLAALSQECLENILDMDPTIANSSEFVEFVSGAYLHEGVSPLAHRYGGHQFGSWADQLGDGRAVMLGEFVNHLGERWELQLKGSGLTPYSRRGDGRAVIRSSVREFLCSEAMHYLGIPTSRAASLLVSDDQVTRDQFYDGHPRNERGAIVLRLAKSWFRIGSLELLTYKGEITLLKQLVDFVIESYFHVMSTDEDRYLAFYSEVVRETANLIAKWQSVGFAHGVCNTDNFSLLSITIDYGPFGFLDEYDPKFVPNTSDDEGMYRYENQPDIGLFNLEKLRLALDPLLTEKQKALMLTIQRGYVDIYKTKFMELFRMKLGLLDSQNDDEQLVAILLKMMEDTRSDFTMTFRCLSEISLSDLDKDIGEQFWAIQRLQKHKWYSQWTKLYVQRVSSARTSEEQRQSLMKSVNPRYILRNWIAQKVITATEANDFTELNLVSQILKKPYTFQTEAEDRGFAKPPPKWARSLRVSCSS